VLSPLTEIFFTVLVYQARAESNLSSSLGRDRIITPRGYLDHSTATAISLNQTLKIAPMIYQFTSTAYLEGLNSARKADPMSAYKSRHWGLDSVAWLTFDRGAPLMI
jgi:hypothetical protein